MKLTMIPLSSLTKVFPDERPVAPAYAAASCLQNEVFSFQVAVYNEYEGERKETLKVSVESDLPVSVRLVGLEPVEMPTYPDAAAVAPEEYLRITSGLFPDPLLPIQGEARFMHNQWTSLWLTVNGRSGLPVGDHTITVRLSNPEGDAESCDFRLNVLPAALPEQKLLYTEWFHCDCIANWYGVEMQSEKHWALIEKYAKTAAENGINMLLTPIITPALDTAVGTERPTMQLVRIDADDDGYRFDFTELDRWFAMCDRAGIRYYEIAHLFSQWGAECAPKVMGWKNGEYVRLFGWETPALSDEYVGFLQAFLPALTDHLRQVGRFERCYFHLSDEPSLDHAEHYTACRRILTPYLPEERLMDALSNVEFWDRGIVKLPIPCNNHIAPFLERGVSPLWTYYCCGQTVGVSNKFLAQPGSTTRIIGAQMFKHHVSGFLQWGYNYWYSERSLTKIDPWRTAGGNNNWPAGDPFAVYPGKNGPIESMRLIQMHEAIQDMSALEALEEKLGHEAVVAMIDDGIEPLRFDCFPRDETYLLNLRERVNAALCQ